MPRLSAETPSLPTLPLQYEASSEAAVTRLSCQYRTCSVYFDSRGQGGIDPGVYAFPAHQVIRYGDRIYDPSYGEEADSIIEWEDALLDAVLLPGLPPFPVANQPNIADLQWDTD